MLSYTVVLFVPAAFLMGAKSKPLQVLEVKQLNIVDSQGVTRISLGLSTDGSSNVTFRSPTGVSRVTLGTDANGGAGLSMYDDKGMVPIDLGLLASGASGFRILDEAGNSIMTVP